MGLSGKTHHQFKVELHETSEKWVTHGISLREPMKPISLPSTTVANKEDADHQDQCVTPGISLREPMKPISLPSTTVANKEDDDHQDQWPATPTADSFRIPTVFPCPPPPKKRKASSKFGYSGTREFFSPPDLETVFIHKATSH